MGGECISRHVCDGYGWECVRLGTCAIGWAGRGGDAHVPARS